MILDQQGVNGNLSQTLRPSPDPNTGVAFVGPNRQKLQIDPSDPLSTEESTSSQMTNLMILRSLTLPEYPNLDIPPSPPRTSTTDLDGKIQHFLRLKEQGVHFNSKLSAATSLKNPSLLQRLTAAAGLEDSARQHRTSMTEDAWNPEAFPPYAFSEELSKAQSGFFKRNEDAKMGKPRHFEPAISGSEGP